MIVGSWSGITNLSGASSSEVILITVEGPCGVSVGDRSDCCGDGIDLLCLWGEALCPPTEELTIWRYGESGILRVGAECPVLTDNYLSLKNGGALAEVWVGSGAEEWHGVEQWKRCIGGSICWCILLSITRTDANFEAVRRICH